MARSTHGMAPPTDKARKFNIPGAQTNRKKLGKLQPRDDAPEVVTTRYEPICIRCREPRESRRFVVCKKCQGGPKKEVVA
jgi:hypothetical protein